MQEVREQNLAPKGFVQVSTLSTATALTTSIPSGALGAYIHAETQNVRWRDDGTSPTASVGIQLAAGEKMFYAGAIAAIKFIEETASAKLNVSFYG